MLPKISCLTVTGGRLVLLKQAIDCYLNQSYPNKELIIVCDGERFYKDAVGRYISFLDRKDIRLILLNEKYKLGQLRNMAVDSASGSIILQWDDDDLYHPHRMQLQYECMNSQNAQACLLADHLSFFEHSRELYWVNWVPYSTFPMHQLFPGSIMAIKDKQFRYPEEGQYATRGEDSIFLSQYYEKAKIASLKGKGYIYVYRYHGTNTFSETHHRWVAKDHACGPEMAKEKINDLIAALSFYHLPQPFTFKTKNDKPFLIYKKLNDKWLL